MNIYSCILVCLAGSTAHRVHVASGAVQDQSKIADSSYLVTLCSQVSGMWIDLVCCGKGGGFNRSVRQCITRLDLGPSRGLTSGLIRGR